MSINVNVGNIIPTNVVEVGNEISADQLAAITAANSPSATNPFATASHIHTIANISGLQTELNKKIEGNHTQPISSITNLQNTLDSKAGVGHTHGIGEVTGLVVALDGKASISETLQVANNLSDLQDAEVARNNLGLGEGSVLNVGGVNAYTGVVVENEGSAIQITPVEITFPDNTTQTTAYTGSFKIADYDNGKTYNAGDQVIFSDKIYKFNNFIGAAGYAPDTNPEAWTELSAGNGGGVTSPITFTSESGYITMAMDGTTPYFQLNENGNTATISGGILQLGMGTSFEFPISISPAGIQFSDGTFQSTAAGGGGGGGNYLPLDGGTLTGDLWLNNPNDLEQKVLVSASGTGTPLIQLSGIYGTNTNIFPEVITLSQNSNSLTLSASVGITFPDGTQQTTAYTGGGGGGGGGSSVAQRLADAFAAQVSYICQAGTEDNGYSWFANGYFHREESYNQWVSNTGIIGFVSWAIMEGHQFYVKNAVGGMPFEGSIYYISDNYWTGIVTTDGAYPDWPFCIKVISPDGSSADSFTCGFLYIP
jgi:hypothetical protein